MSTDNKNTEPPAECTDEQIAKLEETEGKLSASVKILMDDVLPAIAAASAAQGEPVDQVGAPIPGKLEETLARKRAEAKVQQLWREYNVDYASKIKRNIDYLQSLINYNAQAAQLLDYYKTQTAKATQDTSELTGAMNVANRLSTFYNTRDTQTAWWLYYLAILYWGVFTGLLFIFLRDFYKGGYMKALIASVGGAGTRRGNKSQGGGARVGSKIKKLQQDLRGQGGLRDILRGPGRKHRASAALTKPVGTTAKPISKKSARKSAIKYNIVPSLVLIAAFLTLHGRRNFHPYASLVQ